MNYARIIGGVAIDVSPDPSASYHPEVAAEFIVVPDEVRGGWARVGGQWTPPEAEAQPATVISYRTSLSPVEFKMLFAPGERLEIRRAREYAGDAPAQRELAWLIDDWWQIVDDPRLSAVDLSLAQTQDGLTMLVNAGILTPERRDEIGKGLPE